MHLLFSFQLYDTYFVIPDYQVVILSVLMILIIGLLMRIKWKK